MRLARLSLCLMVSLMILGAPRAEGKIKSPKKKPKKAAVKPYDPYAPTPLTRGRSLSTFPRYSPDGKQIAYTNNEGGQLHIWVMDSYGKKTKQISSQLTDMQPAWSPDGKHFIYTSRGSIKTGPLGIWIMNSDGKEPHALLDGKENEGQYPCWSFDGKKVIWTHERALWVADLDDKFKGVNPRALTKPPAAGLEMCGKTNPEWIAYVAGDRIDWSKGAFLTPWLIKYDGTGRRQLSTKPATRIVAWSADNKWIYTQQAGNIYKLPAEGGQSELPFMKFRGIDGTNLDFSPDMKFLAFDDTGDEYTSTGQILRAKVPEN